MSDDLATHAAVALAAHRKWLERQGLPVPDGLDVLVEIAAALSRAQHAPKLAPSRTHPHADVVDVETGGLTYGAAGRRLSVSPSTVRRMVKAGVLPAVRVGARGVRIPAAAVDAHLQAGPRS